MLPVLLVMMVLLGRKAYRETKGRKVLLVLLVTMELLGRKVLKVLPDHKGIKGHKV